MSLRTSPLVREIHAAHPYRAFQRIAHLSHAFFLHSAMSDARSRWSFFGAEPFAVFGPDGYDEAIALWRRARAVAREDFERPAPFTGGLVGCWSYDFGRRLERLPAIAHDDVGWPDVWLAAYDVIGAFEHATGRAWLIADPGAPVDRARSSAKLEAWAGLLEADPQLDDVMRHRGWVYRETRSTFTPDAYRESVERVREHIRRGDLFQANLSQRWTMAFVGREGSPPARRAQRLFEAITERSPAPFSAFLDLGEHAVASASPESFLELRGRRIETRPIKGTRPRGADAAEDERLRAALLASEKDRAENVMIVDVLRNDLGRVAESGSVGVPELCTLETFPQVFHLTSTVTATLRDGLDGIDLLHACFPGGSITGAPKIRAMEILETLEPVRRHLYTGAIGWLDWGGDLSTSIAIRTAMVSRDAIRFAAGGGIVADSDPDAEYRETLAKAEGLRRALTCAGWAISLHPGQGVDPLQVAADFR